MHLNLKHLAPKAPSANIVRNYGKWYEPEISNEEKQIIELRKELHLQSLTKYDNDVKILELTKECNELKARVSDLKRNLVAYYFIVAFLLLSIFDLCFGDRWRRSD